MAAENLRKFLITEAAKMRREAARLERRDPVFYATTIRLNRSHADGYDAELRDMDAAA